MQSPTSDQRSRPKADNRLLDRDLIVETAVEHIELYGVHGLTLRRIGHDLGVEVITMYRYVSGRKDLLDAVVERLLADVRDDVARQPAHTWQRYLQILATAVRGVATDHPAAFPLIALHPAAPWLCPPLRSLGLVEDLLTTLIGHGVTEQEAVDTYRAFSGFLLGQLLLESAARGSDTSTVQRSLVGEAEHSQDTDAPVDADTSPTIFRMRTLLSRERGTEEFEATLEFLLERLARP